MLFEIIIFVHIFIFKLFDNRLHLGLVTLVRLNNLIITECKSFKVLTVTILKTLNKKMLYNLFANKPTSTFQKLIK